MPSPGRPQKITSEELIDAAAAVFLELGVGTTTAAIAKKARVSESVLFHRFKNKEAVLLAVLEQRMRSGDLLDEVHERAGKGVLAESLFDLAMEIIEESKRRMPFVVLATTMAAAPNWKLDQLRAMMRRPHPQQAKALAQLKAYFDAEAKLGRLRAVDTEAMAHVYLGAIVNHVLQKTWFADSEFPSPPTARFLRGMIDLLLQGAQPPTTKKR
jgi:AcrR family transcriptional regulator